MTDKDTVLYLHEEVMLLALRDEQGTAQGPMYPFALGGALLSELLLAGRIAIEDTKKQLVNVLDEKPLGEPLLDEVLEKMAAAKRRASAPNWIQRFAQIRKLKHRIAQQLCDRGILRADEKTILLIFHQKVYPELNPRPERELIERLRKAIFSDSRSVDPRTAVLASLANAADLLRYTFDRKELKRRKARIEQLGDGSLVGNATRKAVQAAQTAAAMAAIIPATAATVAAT